ncbi:MAG: hypothetical protein J5I91_05220 [Bacteroidetes bacterium]|nr:hypothetical protein [Bacteroidota bacterium]
MLITEADIELFDEYLKGNLDSEARIVFEQRLQSDDEFKRTFDVYSTLIDGIKFSAREELKKRIAKEGEVKYIQNIWGKRGSLAAAAILIFFVGLYFVFESNFGKKLLKFDESNSELALEEDLDTEPINNQPRNPTRRMNSKITEKSNNEDIALNGADSSIIDDSNDSTQAEGRIDDFVINDTFVSELDDRTIDKGASFASPIPASVQEEENIVSGQLLIDSTYIAVLINDDILIGHSKIDSFEYAHIKIQFWKSPLNSRVYKFIHSGNNYSAEIYGINPKEIKRIFIKDRNELIILGSTKAYILEVSRDYLPYKVNNDEEFITPLMNLNEN